MLDQVEPTLLIYTVWPAIDLVPSWTKKINPRASDNRPTNRRTKRIMAFYARKTCIARLSLTPLARPVQSARTTSRWGRAVVAARPPARPAGRPILRILLPSLEIGPSEPLPLAPRPTAKGLLRG